MNIPMPNDPIVINGESCTVIASVVYTDDPDYSYTLLILRKKAPFYRVVDVDDDRRVIDDFGSFYNIVPAVSKYEDCGGDY